MPPELDDILADIQKSIAEITEKQDTVREKLMQYMKARQEAGNQAKAKFNARKAQSAYGSE
jgi:hypothetical protein